MSIFNEIQESGLNQILTRRLDIKGDVPAPAIVPEIGPQLVLENDRPEWGFLKGERLAARWVSVAAVAAQFGAVQLYLPPASREVVTIQRITFLNANSVSLAEATVIDGGLVGWVGTATQVRDFRWPASATALVISTTTNVAQPSNFGVLAQAATSQAEIVEPIIITPGQSLMIYANVVNQALAMNIYWRERVGTASELG